jgi:hypothetical protein
VERFREVAKAGSIKADRRYWRLIEEGTMNARLGFRVTIVLAALAGTAQDLAAQGKLPEKMTGTWASNAPTQGGARGAVGGTWSVLIAEQKPDGSIAGKATWEGGRLCAMNDEPMTGRFDGTELRMAVTFQNKFPNAGCSKANLVLRKAGEGNTFEGELRGSGIRMTLGSP